MGRSPCCEKVGLKKGPWTPEEDQKLMAYIEQHGHGSWRALPAKAGKSVARVFLQLLFVNQEPLIHTYINKYGMFLNKLGIMAHLMLMCIFL